MNELNDIKVSGCKREDCPVNQGGSCIEDVEHAEDCSNAIIQEPKAPKPREEYRTVDQGRGLSLENIATMQMDRYIPTASIVGAGTSGKTTFLAVLFYQFLRNYNGFDGHYFMDSDSFLALNEKLHYADIKSKSNSVQMPRSSLQEEPAFHFKTKDKKNQTHECIWVDIPGELMEQRLSKDTVGWQEYVGLARSTHVVLFLDLSVIADPKKRGPHIEQAIDALANSIQSKTWDGRDLMVVFSKADAYEKKLQKEIKSIKSRLLARLSDDFESVDFCELHSLGSETNSGKSIAKVWKWIHTKK